MRAQVRYEAIYANRGKFAISLMCEFFGVSRSGYYAWAKRRKAPDRDEKLGELIRTCQKKTKQTYGYRRVRLWLLYEAGMVISDKVVLRLMRKYNLLAQIHRPRPWYQRNQQMATYENRLSRNFHADKPNQKWVTDISYIHTKEGVLYLSVIKDLHDSFIVAYDMGTVQDNALVYRTVQKAKKEVADGLILHSDQGFQYTSCGYLNQLNSTAFCFPCQELQHLWIMRPLKISLASSKLNVFTGAKLHPLNTHSSLYMTISISTTLSVFN